MGIQIEGHVQVVDGAGEHIRWEGPAPDPQVKDTNPKDAVGSGKVPFSTVPAQVIAEVGLAMLEGARKYGRHNYRVAGVRASVYYDGTMRHLTGWWEGQDMDPDTDNRVNHITKAIASLTVLRDAMLNDMWTDDRPPPVKNQNWVKDMNEAATALNVRYPDPKPAYIKGDTQI